MLAVPWQEGRCGKMAWQSNLERPSRANAADAGASDVSKGSSATGRAPAPALHSLLKAEGSRICSLALPLLEEVETKGFLFPSSEKNKPKAVGDLQRAERS